MTPAEAKAWRIRRWTEQAALDEEALRWPATREPVERDELLAPIRLLEARRAARALLRTLEFGEGVRRRCRAAMVRELSVVLRNCRCTVIPYQRPPWWSPLPESVSGVLRAWWRRWRAR